MGASVLRYSRKPAERTRPISSFWTMAGSVELTDNFR
jgi:hypothetical protein